MMKRYKLTSKKVTNLPAKKYPLTVPQASIETSTEKWEIKSLRYFKAILMSILHLQSWTKILRQVKKGDNVPPSLPLSMLKGLKI